jgi:hypothetical protein
MASRERNYRIPHQVLRFAFPLRLIFWTGLAAICLLAGPIAAEQSGTAAKQGLLPNGYLMLVAGNRANTLTPEQLTLFAQSPYDGLAVRFLTQYDTTPPPTVEEMTARLQELKKTNGKEYWPWVFLNRMVGKDAGFDSSYGRDPYFARTNGLDLEDKSGAKRDFLHIWRNSMRAARQAGMPGMVADFELYLNYKAYEPALLAKQIGKPVDETLQLLNGLGRQLADAAAQEYPDGTIWFLFTDLGQLGWKTEGSVKYYPTPAYIVLGLLEEIRLKNYGLRVISGGEVGLEYCSFNLDHLKRKIDGRARDFAPHLQQYPGSLELGGTLILWPDRKSKTEFMAEGPCGKSAAATVEEQEPYLELLLSTYRYNWIYGTHNSGYDPFNPATAARFNGAILRAKAAAKKHGSTN